MSKFSIDPPDHNVLKIYIVVTFSPGLSEPGAGMFFTLEIISLEMYSSQRSSEVFSELKYDFVKKKQNPLKNI